MKHGFCVLLIAFALAAGALPVSANDYDRNDSDNPMRLAGYVLHPVGVLLEWTVTRPIHWLAHRPGFDYIMGHEAVARARVVVPLEDHVSLPASEIVLAPPADAKPVDSRIEVTPVPGGMQYAVVGDILFRPGSDQLANSGAQVLDSLAKTIRDRHPGCEILIEGHTDDQQIRHSAWKSNWELGSARANTLLHYLVEKQGFAPEKLGAVTFGPYRPKAPNTTPENQSKNRRAVLTVKTPPAP